MHFENTNLSDLIARGARAAHSIAGEAGQTFDEWLFAIEKKDGWAGIEDFFALAGDAKASSRMIELEVQDQLAINLVQFASSGFIACMSTAVISTLTKEGVI